MRLTMNDVVNKEAINNYGVIINKSFKAALHY